MGITRIKFSNISKKTIRASLIFVSAVTVIFLLSRLPLIHPVVQKIQGGLVNLGTAINKKIFYSSQSEDDWKAKALTAEALAGNLAISQTELTDLRVQVSELQKLFSYVQESATPGKLAHILSRSINNEGTVLINLGNKDGLRPELAVIVEGGHLIGTIETVNDYSSVVRLSTDDQSKIPASVYSDARTIGLVEGQDGFLLKLNFVTQDQMLTPGQIVATSGLDGSLPAGLIIGVIELVIKEERAPFQSALVRPLFDSQFYSYVYVLDPLKRE